jgi:hypothetical protein
MKERQGLMKTKFNAVPNEETWIRTKNHCRTTDNKDFTEKSPTGTFKRKLLMSEHTPIRLLEFDWSWKGIPYWLSTELSRHRWEKFISSQRDDRLIDDTPRAEKPQGALVNYDGFANMQNLIDVARKRLCYKATTEARELIEDFKLSLFDEGFMNESEVLVPNCIYRGGCPEFTSCGLYKRFLDYCKENHPHIDLSDLQARYKAYNYMFYTKYEET